VGSAGTAPEARVEGSELAFNTAHEQESVARHTKAEASLDDTSPLPGTEVQEANAQQLSRIDWATLLKRVYGIDSLACPRCGGRLKFTDVFEDTTVARAELEQRGLPFDPSALARARASDDPA
jgi:hypothetical protein